MPRVHTKTKNRGGTKTYTCRYCQQAVEPGQAFYQWTKRYGGPQYCHVACGFPRPSWLSGRKTAIVEDAIQDAGKDLGALTFELEQTAEPGDTVSLDDVVSDAQSVLESVADEAEGVADEYESSADNMPESLQYGSQAEAMRDVAERLREWADNLRSFDPTTTSADLPELTDEGGRDAWQDDAQTAIDDAVSEIVSDAESLMEDLPEYEG